MASRKQPVNQLMNRRNQLWRYSRHVHAWFSAFAFLMLLLFAITGILLNHPQWFNNDTDHEQTTILTIPDALAAQLKLQEDPSEELITYVRGQLGVLGRFKSSDVLDDEIDIQLTGPYGSTDMTANIDQKTIEVVLSQSSLVSTLSDLHRGKNVAPAWRWVIDISAGVIVMLSLIGFVLFFAQRGRTFQHIWIMVISLIILAGLLLLGVQ